MTGHSTVLELLALGGVAGVLPVYLGIALALAAARALSRSWEGFFVGLANGVLFYLFFDLMHEAVELTGARDTGSWFVFLGSLLVGFVGLVLLEQHQSRNRVAHAPHSLPYTIALGMGLHNLGEGLSIGAGYANGEWVLSGLLVAGYALHNGTEGFGIIASAGRACVGTRDVVMLGLIAGGPTCLGALFSGQTVSPALSLICYTLAAGSLLYVILTLTTISYTVTRRLNVALGVFAGIALMYVTAMLLTLVAGVPT